MLLFREALSFPLKCRYGCIVVRGGDRWREGESSPTWRQTPRRKAEVGTKGAGVVSHPGGINPSGHEDECDEKFISCCPNAGELVFLRTSIPSERGGEHATAAQASGSSHANDLQENGRYLQKNRQVEEGRVVVPPAWSMNNIYIINIVRENQGSDYFSPPGL